MRGINDEFLLLHLLKTTTEADNSVKYDFGDLILIAIEEIKCIMRSGLTPFNRESLTASAAEILKAYESGEYSEDVETNETYEAYEEYLESTKSPYKVILKTGESYIIAEDMYDIVEAI